MKKTNFIWLFVLALIAFIADTVFLKSGIGLATATLLPFSYRMNRDKGNGTEGGDGLTPELKAIAEIAEQIEQFKILLGESAKQSDFDSVTADLATLKEGLKTMTDKEVLAKMDSINSQNSTILLQIAELQEKDNAGKEENTGKGKKKGEFVTVKSIEEFINKTFVDGVKTRETASIEVKAPEDFGYPQTFEGVTGTDMTAFTGRFVDPELYKIRHKRNMILDYFEIQTISVPTLIYLQKEEIGDSASVSGDPGSADWILSGQIKPKRSFRLSTGKVDAKKIAIFGTIQDELLQDVPSMQNWIREDFDEQMREGINDGLLNNNPAVNSEAPLGLKTNAIQFSPTPAFDNTVENPNYIDDLVAVFALMAYNREEAGMAFVSSDVWYRIHILKDLNERYQNQNMVYTDRLGRLFISGVRIEWVDYEDIASTHVLVIGRDLGFKIKAYGAMVFERGLNGADFRYDRTSFRGYQRFLSYIPSNRENSVLYDTWVNIKAAIAAPIS